MIEFATILTKCNRDLTIKALHLCAPTRRLAAAPVGRACSAILLLLLSSISVAQAPSTQPLTPADLKFQLLSIGPGKPIYEWFGHNAILVTDKRTGVSIAYNYGVFEFDEGFLGRFIEGRMMYTQEAYDGQKLIQSYIKSDRSI